MKKKLAKKFVKGLSILSAVGAGNHVFDQSNISWTKSPIAKLCNASYAYVYGCGVGIFSFAIGNAILDIAFDTKKKESAKNDDGINEEDPTDSAFDDK